MIDPTVLSFPKDLVRNSIGLSVCLSKTRIEAAEGARAGMKVGVP